MLMSQQHLTDDEDDWEQMMEHLVTEDDTPVDNRFSERQQRLLPAILFSSWEEGKPFEALSNVGLFYSLHGEPPVVPDFMLSLQVEPRPVTGKKADRSYMTWIYGKPPDLVIEVVSNREGEELGRKLEIYAKVRVTFYVVYDPFQALGDRELRAFRLVEGKYLEMVPPTWFPEVELGLTIWDGPVEDVEARWLRFTDVQGELLLTPEEKAEASLKEAREAVERAEEADSRADEASARAESSEARAEESRARAEQSEARAEQSEARAKQSEARAKQSEAELHQARANLEAMSKKLRDLGIEP